MESKQVVHPNDLDAILNDLVDKAMSGNVATDKFRPRVTRLGSKAGGYRTEVVLDESSVRVTIIEPYTFVKKISATYLIKSQSLVGLNVECLGCIKC